MINFSLTEIYPNKKLGRLLLYNVVHSKDDLKFGNYLKTICLSASKRIRTNNIMVNVSNEVPP